VTQPVVEALTARHFLQRGYLVWTDLAIDEGSNGDIDVLACNAKELVFVECKDNKVDKPGKLLQQMKRAVAHLKSKACEHSALAQSLPLRVVLVLPKLDCSADRWRDINALMKTENIEVLDADEVIKAVIGRERELLNRRRGNRGRRGRYGQQTDTLLNFIKWLVDRDYLKV
jgi:Holliday junction resolvase-like predicted endonuclease